MNVNYENIKLDVKYRDEFLTVEKTKDSYCFHYDNIHGFIPSVMGEYLIKNLKEGLEQGYYILNLIVRLELYSTN